MAPPNDEKNDNDDASGATPPLPPTEMIYYTYEGNFQLECEAEILAIRFLGTNDDKNNTNDNNNGNNTNNNGNDEQQRTLEVVLNRTVLHAQGGGQPTDHGTIRIQASSDGDGDGDEDPPTAEIAVTKVVLDRATGVAFHTGTLVAGSSSSSSNNSSNNDSAACPWIGRTATVTADGERRRLLSECHTAGHVVDSAMARCGRGLPPTKGYHFLDGPYVEYKGNIPAGPDRDRFLSELRAIFAELVASETPTEISTLGLSEAESVCGEATGGEDWYGLRKQFGGGGSNENNENDNDNDNDAEPSVRIVRVAGWPCPCGGTHARNTGELASRNWGITGFRSKKGVVRVRYGMNWDGTATATATTTTTR